MYVGSLAIFILMALLGTLGNGMVGLLSLCSDRCKTTDFHYFALNTALVNLCGVLALMLDYAANR